MPAALVRGSDDLGRLPGKCSDMVSAGQAPEAAQWRAATALHSDCAMAGLLRPLVTNSLR